MGGSSYQGWGKKRTESLMIKYTDSSAESLYISGKSGEEINMPDSKVSIRGILILF